jgi:hypothetical protein
VRAWKCNEYYNYYLHNDINVLRVCLYIHITRTVSIYEQQNVYNDAGVVLARNLRFEFPPSLLFIIFRIFGKRDYPDFCGCTMYVCVCVCVCVCLCMSCWNPDGGGCFIRGVKKSFVNITSTKSRSTQPLFPFSKQISSRFFSLILFNNLVHQYWIIKTT